jgi:hypothetical protein
MVRSMKSAGLAEVDSLRRRTRRLLSLGRLFPEDCAYITKRLNEIEARIVTMNEINEYGKEE